MRGQFQIIINFTRFNFESYIEGTTLRFDLLINGKMKLRGESKIHSYNNRWFYGYPEFKKFSEFNMIGEIYTGWNTVDSLNDIDLIKNDIDIIHLFKKFIWLNLEAQEGLANLGAKPND